MQSFFPTGKPGALLARYAKSVPLCWDSSSRLTSTNEPDCEEKHPTLAFRWQPSSTRADKSGDMSKTITDPCTCTICTFPADQDFDVDAREFLKCKRLFNDFVSPGVMAADEDSYMFEEKQWWLRFEPHAKPWITAAINAGEIESPTEAWFGAAALIAVCYDAEYGKREWLELTGFELFFENIGHGGLYPGWSTRPLVLGMRSFMRYLGEHGVVDSVSAAHIDRELCNWEERIVDYLENDGPWCRSEKTSQRQEAN